MIVLCGVCLVRLIWLVSMMIGIPLSHTISPTPGFAKGMDWFPSRHSFLRVRRCAACELQAPLSQVTKERSLSGIILATFRVTAL